MFVEIRPDTLNLDETHLESLVTRRTKAIVALHYGGVGCEMDTVLQVAHQYGIAVVEDNAHSLFAQYKGKYLGTLGDMGILSFHETKNFTCGEGGALILNNPKYLELAEIIREKGTNRRKFFLGQVDKYTWLHVGSSYLLSDLLAAFLYAQLEHRDLIRSKRREIWEYYQHHLKDWAVRRNVRLPMVPSDCDPVDHVFPLVMPSSEQRDALLLHLKSRQIMGVFHYLPLHLSPMGRTMGYRDGDFPVTEHVSRCLLRLPFYNHISESELQRVVSTLLEWHP